jgi:CheY-like chemotaxis protein
VPNGEAALLQFAADETFDVMVTDYDMPGMTGAELATYAREMHPRMGTLVITGYADNDRFDHLLRDVEILRKPFTREDLVRRVRKLADQSMRLPFGHIASDVLGQDHRIVGPPAHTSGP